MLYSLNCLLALPQCSAGREAHYVAILQADWAARLAERDSRVSLLLALPIPLCHMMGREGMAHTGMFQTRFGTIPNILFASLRSQERLAMYYDEARDAARELSPRLAGRRNAEVRHEAELRAQWLARLELRVSCCRDFALRAPVPRTLCTALHH